MTGALAGALPALHCPVCAGDLRLEGRVVRCAGGHAFDVARQGHVHLAHGRALRGDTAAMVAAREEVLSAGHYAPLTEALVRAAATEVPGVVADVGGGTGHHLAAVLDAAPHRVGVVLDSSAAALRRAARGHPRMAAVACDAWRALPLRDGAAAVVLSVFAPRDADELARVLAPGGTLVVATPTSAHLAELVTALGMIGVDPDKQARLTKTFGRRFETTSSTLVEAGLQLPRAHAALVAGMGPSAHHLDPAALAARVAELPDPVRATLSVTVRCLSSAG